MNTPRFKNDDGQLILRNNDDTDNANAEFNAIKLTGGTLEAGKVLTSDVDGLGSWETNEAIALANDAKTAADAAQAAADAAQAAADLAQAAADAAAAQAAAATTAAAAAQATADSAFALATAASAAVVIAQASADAAQATADDALITADIAVDMARTSFPSRIAVFADELISTVGTPFFSISSALPYNISGGLLNNGDSAYTYVTLRKGTWMFRLLTQTANSLGRLTIALNGNPIIDPQDLYAATNDPKKLFTYTDYVVPEYDVYTLTFTISGKNPSSSGYSVVLTKFIGIRTGD